jgi:hypothetical protein
MTDLALLQGGGLVAGLNLGQAAGVLLHTVGWRAVLDVVIISFLSTGSSC